MKNSLILEIILDRFKIVEFKSSLGRPSFESPQTVLATQLNDFVNTLASLPANKKQGNESENPQGTNQVAIEDYLIGQISLKNICLYIQQKYPQASGVYLNVPDNDHYLREFTLPFIEEKKVKEVYPLELSSSLPVDIAQLVFDKISYINLEKKSTSLVAIAAKSKNLLTIANLFNSYDLRVIDYYSSIEAFFRLLHIEHDDNKVALHLGAYSSYLIVIEDNRLISARIIPRGWKHLIQNIKVKVKKDELEITEIINMLSSFDDEVSSSSLKKHYNIDITIYKKIKKEFDLFFIQLLQEVKISLIRVSSFNNDEQLQKLKLLWITDFSNSLLLDSFFQKFDMLTTKNFSLEKTPIAIFGREYCVATAAGISLADKHGLKFLTKSLRKSLVGDKKFNYWAPVIVLGVSIFVFSVTFYINHLRSSFKISIVIEENKKLFRRAFGVAPNKKSTLSLMTQARQLIEKKRNKMSLLAKYSGLTISQILIELNQVIDGESVQIERVKYDPNTNSLNITGLAGGNNELNNFINSLKDSRYYANEIKKTGVREKPVKNGERKWQFTLTLKPLKMSMRQPSK